MSDFDDEMDLDDLEHIEEEEHDHDECEECGAAIPGGLSYCSECFEDLAGEDF